MKQGSWIRNQGSAGTIDNGRRAEVSFGPYRGVAGIAKRNGVTEIAFWLTDFRSIREVRSGLVDSVRFSVIDVQRSASIKGMVVLSVREQVSGVRGQRSEVRGQGTGNREQGQLPQT